MNTNERHTELIDSYRKEKNFQRQYHEGLRCLLEPYGLSVMEADILFAISRDPQCDNITKLCADIGKTKGVVSRACDHLCKENYLIGKNDNDDRRVIHFKTTGAVRSLIASLSRYMESMEYLHQVKDSDSLLSGRLDGKKSLFYLIREDDTQKDLYPYLPFCSYESFLREKCLPRLHPHDQDSFIEAFSLAAIEETLHQTERMESIWQMQFHRVFRPVLFSAQIIENSHDAVLLKAQNA